MSSKQGEETDGETVNVRTEDDELPTVNIAGSADARPSHQQGATTSTTEEITFLEPTARLETQLEQLQPPPLLEEDQDEVEEKEKEGNDEGTNKSEDLASKSTASNFGSFDMSDDRLEEVEALIGMETATTSNRRSADQTPASVTPQRKEELILQARSDRLRWVQQVPLPYLKEKQDNTTSGGAGSHRWSSFLQYSHATQHLPAAASILKYMYGQEEPSTRAATILEQSNVDENTVLLSGNQILQAEIDICTQKDTKILLENYHAFLHRLQDPACGTLVQNLRNFCRNFRDLTDPTEAASKLQAYPSAAYESLVHHTAFNNDDYKGKELAHSIESFVFGQCRSHLETLFWTPEQQMKDETFCNKLQKLQFLTPSHLDIHCLDDDHYLPNLLAEPVQALRSVHDYHSVYDKLQRFLDIYRGVNAALSTALNTNNGDNNNSDSNNANNKNTEKLPSADDVLPVIILTVVMAQPRTLLYNLKLVDELSPQEYLRGEAGYALTNVFGAVQFLQDLDLDQEPASLSISKEALTEALEAVRRGQEERQDQDRQRQAEEAKDEDLVCLTSLSPLEIRSARLRGERVDIDWALEWQREHGKPFEDLAPGAPESDGTDVSSSLPAGFRRNYSFLTSQPEDIKLSDLPVLLEEYRMLVRATETLLGEKTAKASAARRAKARAMTRSLDESLLLPEATYSK